MCSGHRDIYFLVVLSNAEEGARVAWQVYVATLQRTSRGQRYSPVL